VAFDTPRRINDNSMKNIIRIISTTLLLALTSAGFACDYPKKVDMPDGITATKEDMLSGQRNVKEFVANMEVYLECIVAEEKESRSQAENLEPEEEQLREDLLNKKYNAAVDDMEIVAANFNIAVQSYKAREE
jgi:hypothetical protein